MYSVPHLAESGDSSQSLLSRRQSEMGSHYVTESGVFMSSFTATISITAVVTIGVLMLTMLIALTIMLVSCQSNGSGVLDVAKKSEQHAYCSLFDLYAELNNLEVSEFPLICKPNALKFIQGQYLQSLNTSLWFVEEYLSTLKPDDDGLDVILLDADDILSLIGNFSRISSIDWKKQVEDIKLQAFVLLIRLQMQLRASNWPLILFTRTPVKYLNKTLSMLNSSGYAGWSSLIMRSDVEIEMESWEYLSSRRLQLQKQGFRFTGLISSQLDAFRGTCLGRRNFKLPNLLYYELKDHVH